MEDMLAHGSESIKAPADVAAPVVARKGEWDGLNCWFETVRSDGRDI